MTHFLYLIRRWVNFRVGQGIPVLLGERHGSKPGKIPDEELSGTPDTQWLAVPERWCSCPSSSVVKVIKTFSIKF
jgi:hypothetical protein